MLAGAVIAGGKSTRMGTDKGFLEIPDTNISLLEHSKKVLNEICDIEVMVSGDKYPEGIADIYPGCGPLSGIHAILQALKRHHGRVTEVLFLPVDMPIIGCNDLLALRKEGRKSAKLCCFDKCYLPLYMPIREKTLIHISAKLSSGALSYGDAKKNDYSIKSLIRHLGGVQIASARPSSLNNINTPEQWERHCLEIQ